MQHLLGPQGTALFLLIAEIVILLGMFFGFYLIRYRKSARPHHRVQTTLVLANLVLILAAMTIGFYRYVIQGGAASPAVSLFMIGHAVAGAVAEGMALYITIQMSGLLPKRPQLRNYKGLMRATLALWALVALGGFAVYYGQYVAPTSEGEKPPIANPTPAPVTPGATGVAAWGDFAGFNDMITLVAVNLPPPARGKVYQGWLISRTTAVFQYAGTMEVQDDGTSLVQYQSPGGISLLGQYDQILVTSEDAPASKDGPSSDVVLNADVPSEAGVYLRNLLFKGPESPSGVGLVSGLRFSAATLLIHSNEMQSAQERGSVEAMKRHAEHLINLIEGQSGDNYGDPDGDGSPQDPGDGLGLLTYARLASEHSRLAQGASDSTPAIRTHAPMVITMANNVSGWATRIRDDALAVIASSTIQGAQAEIADAVALSRRAFAGFDQNGDAEISPIPNEGGVVQIQAHARTMASLSLLAGPVILVQNPRPQAVPVAPTPTPSPGPRTVVVLMPGLNFRDKTIVIPRGTTVIWVNDGTAKHYVVRDDGRFESPVLTTGEGYSFTFNQPGRYSYYCPFHGDKGGIGMAGLVIVE